MAEEEAEEEAAEVAAAGPGVAAGSAAEAAVAAAVTAEVGHGRALLQAAAPADQIIPGSNTDQEEAAQAAAEAGRP